MSSREHKINLVYETLKSTLLPSGDAYNLGACSIAIVDTLLPQITKPEQLLDVPERSLLVSDGGICYEWFQGELTVEDALWDAAAILNDSPLTVVWMP